MGITGKKLNMSDNLQVIHDLIAEMRLLEHRIYETPISDRYPLERERYTLNSRLSELAAAHYGWKISRSELSLACLARRGHHDGRAIWRFQDFCSDAALRLDHHFYCRGPDNRAAGIISQPYGLNYEYCTDHYAIDTARQHVIEAAALIGLRVTYPTDFPAWHNPATTLVVITPAWQQI